MQIVFYTDNTVLDYFNMNNEIFPSAPKRCPFKDCSMPVELKMHGYYKRFFISKSFSGILYIRRYICPICGRTVSMLPMFCIQYLDKSVFSFYQQLYMGHMFIDDASRYPI